MGSNEDTNRLAHVLFGDRREAAQHYNAMLTAMDLEKDWWTTTENPGKRAYERYLRLLPHLSAIETATDLRELVSLHEQATIVDSHLGALLTVQINLVLGTLLEQHHRTGEVDLALTELLSGKAVGAYVLTEVGHGSDLNNLETTATYDSSNGAFVLHTPTDTAIKFMPTTAPPPVDGVARWGIVFAQLVLDGGSQGNYPFLVRLVDADGQVRPGITIRPMPEKPALGMDNALTRFDHVHIPGECLLSHTGTQIDDSGQLVSPIPADNQAWRAISRVRLGRLCISAMAAATSRAALSIATDHAAQREIPSMAGGRIPLSQVPAHSAPLLDILSDTYVATVAVEVAVAAFAAATDDDTIDQQGPHLTDLVSLTKYFCTSTALRVCDEVRDRLGAQGVFAHNRIVEFRALRDAAATAEGDSYVIALQASYRRLSLPDEWTPWEDPAPCDIDTPENWLAWMSARERYLQHKTREAYNNASGDRQTRWDSVWDLALAAAEAHIAHQSARALNDRARELPAGSRTVVQNLVALFAVRQYLAHGAELFPEGPLPKTLQPVRDMRNQLHALLAPHLTELVDAFELDSDLLGVVFDDQGYVTRMAKALSATG